MRPQNKNYDTNWCVHLHVQAWKRRERKEL